MKFGLAFQHIPPIEFQYLYNCFPVYGEKLSSINSPKYNTGFIESLIKSQMVQALFVGHDHFNNFGGYYKNIELNYGIKSGYDPEQQ